MRKEIEKTLDAQDMVVIAEYRLLNAIFLKPENIMEKKIDREIFVHEVCKSLFDSIEHCYNNKIPVTEEAVFQYGSGIDINISSENIHTIATLQLDKNVETKDMCEALYKTKQSLKAISLMREVEAITHSNPILTPEQEDKIRMKMYEAENLLLSTVNIKKVETAEEMARAYKEAFDERRNGKKYRFYEPLLDKLITYGPAPGCGGLIAAATGMGKSAYCLSIIDRLKKAGVPIMYYSLEMGRTDTMDREVAKNIDVPLADIVNPPDPDTWQAINEKLEKFLKEFVQDKNFRFSECASLTLGNIKQDIIKFQQEIGQQYMVVVFELLSMIKDFMIVDKSGVNFAQGIEVAINVLNAMAKELGFHYIAVLQMNRKSEDGRIDDLKDIEKFRPSRSQIKNSGAFLERVRYALTLFRPKYYAEAYLEDASLYEDMQDICHVSLLKQNQGKVSSSLRYLFDGETMNMIPLEDEDLTKEGEE